MEKTKQDRRPGSLPISSTPIPLTPANLLGPQGRLRQQTLTQLHATKPTSIKCLAPGRNFSLLPVEKSTHFRSRGVGRKSRLTQNRRQSQSSCLATGHRNSRTDLRFLIGCWRDVSWLHSLLPLQLPSLGLQPPAPPRRPSLRLCATQPRLLSFLVFSLAIQLTRRCLHCTSVGHLLGSLLFFPWLQVPASSPRKESILAFLVQGRGNFESLDDK